MDRLNAEVNEPIKAYIDMVDVGEYDLISALIGGTKSMRNAGKQFLPQEPGEDNEDYDNRLKRSFLFGGFTQTIRKLAGMPHAKPLAFSDNFNEETKGYIENIDLENRTLDVFSKACCRTAWDYGLVHILVDYPVAGGIRTEADRKKVGARPYLNMIHPTSLIGWKFQNGRLTQIRLRELKEVSDGDYGVVETECVRIINEDSFVIYQKDEKDNWNVLEEGALTLGKIPLVTIYFGRTGYMTGRSPLLDLAWLNLEHWQSYSDQRNILHKARVPILFASGVNVDDKIKISPNHMIKADKPDAKLSYVEHSGAAIEAGRKDLEDLLRKMEYVGSLPLVLRPGTITATQKAINKAESDTEINATTQELEDGLNEALALMGEWRGISDIGKISLNRDYGSVVGDSDAMKLLLEDFRLGVISQETYLQERKRRGGFSSMLDIEKELELTKSNPNEGEKIE